MLVLALGFDLFFKPRLMQAAQSADLTLSYQETDAASAGRVVADASVPGVLDALRRIRAAQPSLPVVACYPHVDTATGDALRALGAVTMTRGAFNADLTAALTAAVDA